MAEGGEAFWDVDRPLLPGGGGSEKWEVSKVGVGPFQQGSLKFLDTCQHVSGRERGLVLVLMWPSTGACGR